jgi:drug/metabolite transporter (DMT)-like permease
MTWIVYVIAAALALAAADIFVKAAAGKLPNSLGMLLYGSIPFAAGLFWWLIDRRNVAPADITTKGVIFGLAVGVMFATVTFCMYAAFRAAAPISLASPVIRLGGLVVASIAGLVLWKEPMTMRYVAGLAMVCLGIYFMLAR